ncbi:Spo11/DNA topoisomerase VI subunit A [Xylaria nigripes]|nr:Spo11/DNA topoisomerase VI subunit A [Xylaria nigripes]
MEDLLNANRPTHGLTQSDNVFHEDPRRNPQTGVIIAKIEEILITNLDALQDNRPMTIPLCCRSTGRMHLVQFPSYRNGEARRFTALLQILHLSHEALIAGTVITKRAIYYQNPELFGSQRYVDNLVDDIAFTFGLGRDALNIVAGSKGLIAGAITIKLNNDFMLNCNSEEGQGIRVPDVRAIADVSIGAIKWLLVIEKEATFRGLVDSRFHETATVGPGVLVTAKGYPDLPTRQFLHVLHTKFPRLPTYALVDFDPDGVAIMLTYKNGSRLLQHEENVKMDRLHWIGPRSSDIFGHDHQSLSSAATNSQVESLHELSASPGEERDSNFAKATLPLKPRDRRLAVKLLAAAFENGICIDNVDFIRELQVMLLLNAKAEIQAVDEAGDLTSWLDRALTAQITEYA